MTLTLLRKRLSIIYYIFDFIFFILNKSYIEKIFRYVLHLTFLISIYKITQMMFFFVFNIKFIQYIRIFCKAHFVLKNKASSGFIIITISIILIIISGISVSCMRTYLKEEQLLSYSNYKFKYSRTAST